MVYAQTTHNNQWKKTRREMQNMNMENTKRKNQTHMRKKRKTNNKHTHMKGAMMVMTQAMMDTVMT